MEEKKDEMKEAGSCAKGGCGLRCGCCACRAIKGLALLLIGGAIGYGIGHSQHRRWARRMCPMEVAAPAQSESAPAPTAVPKKSK